MNLRPSGYEPDELPGCSIPRRFCPDCVLVRVDRLERYGSVVFSRFGGDLLSHVLRRSTIGATALNDRVRNGAGCFARAMTTKPRKDHAAPKVRRVAGSVSRSEARCHTPSFRVRVHQPAFVGGVVSRVRCMCMLLSVRSQVCVPVCYWIKSSLSDH